MKLYFDLLPAAKQPLNCLHLVLEIQCFLAFTFMPDSLSNVNVYLIMGQPRVQESDCILFRAEQSGKHLKWVNEKVPKGHAKAE